MVKEAKEFSLSLSYGKCRPARQLLRAAKFASVCVSKTLVLLCSVLGKVVKSWQAISTPGQALPAALAVKE